MIVLCYTQDNEYCYNGGPPLGILSTGTYLECNNVDIEYYDERIHSIKRFEELIKQNPLAVAFSVWGGYQIESAIRLSDYIRKVNPDIKIVWGGKHPSMVPEQTINNRFIDYLIIGEGENAFLNLIKHLQCKSKPLNEVKGIAYKEGGKVIITPRQPLMCIDNLPFVFQGKAIRILQQHLRNNKNKYQTGFELSRGCMFRCSFCYSNYYFKNSLRLKSHKKMLFEFKKLKKLGINSIDIIDDVLLGGNIEHVEKMLDILKELDFSWSANFRIDALSSNLLKKIEETKCTELYFGLESFDNITLMKINKGFTQSQIRRGLRLLKNSRIPVVFSLIAGLPSEEKTMEVINHLKYIKKIIPRAEIQVQSFVALPNTPLYKEAMTKGFIPPRNLRSWANYYHLSAKTPWLKDPYLPIKLYLTTYLAYRFKNRFSKYWYYIAIYPFNKLALYRLRNSYFNIFIEKSIFETYFFMIKSYNRIKANLILNYFIF